KQSLTSRGISLKSPFSISSLGNRFEPSPTAYAPALNHSRKLSRVGLTPPVTTVFASAIAPLFALINLEPSTSPGNNFTTSAPETRALYISVKVETPGNQGMPASRQTRPTSGLKIGCTIK